MLGLILVSGNVAPSVVKEVTALTLWYSGFIWSSVINYNAYTRIEHFA